MGKHHGTPVFLQGCTKQFCGKKLEILRIGTIVNESQPAFTYPFHTYQVHGKNYISIWSIPSITIHCSQLPTEKKTKRPPIHSRPAGPGHQWPSRTPLCHRLWRQRHPLQNLQSPTEVGPSQIGHQSFISRDIWI